MGHVFGNTVTALGVAVFKEAKPTASPSECRQSCSCRKCERCRAEADGIRRFSVLLRDIMLFPGTDLLHCAGAPFEHLEVQRLASSMYENRCFDDVQQLADLLEQLGVRDHPIAKHLRSEGVHRLGCWAIDRILGKS